MARKKNVVPTYLLHKSSGQARVRIDGHDYLLGPYGSNESRVAYGDVIARYVAGLPPIDPMAKAKPVVDDGDSEDVGPSVAEICLAFWVHAKKHYVKNGEPTSEVICFDCCIKILRGLYGLSPAKDFGPLALKAVRAKMVAGDPDEKDSDGEPRRRKPWSRQTVNRRFGRIRHIFKHAIENEMIDESVLRNLQTVAPLLKGRDHRARDNKKRHAIDQDKIDPIRNLVQPLVRDLIDLQLLSGARSGELLKLTSRMIERIDNEWNAELADHKCVHHDQARVIPFGPKAQVILSKYLSDNPDEPLFPITRPADCRALTRACKAAGTRMARQQTTQHAIMDRHVAGVLCRIPYENLRPDIRRRGPQFRRVLFRSRIG